MEIRTGLVNWFDTLWFKNIPRCALF